MRHIMLFLVFIFVILPPAHLFAQASVQRPNLVLILADDMGYGDLHCYNRDSRIPTPNMDRLASQGMLFTDAHTPSSVCTPTRYGILTGRYCWRSRLKSWVLNGYSPLLIEPGRMTIASFLKQHGYRTACVGKWHLGLQDNKKTDYDKPLTPGPTTVGFDYFFGIPASLDMPPYVFIENDRPVTMPTGHIDKSAMARRGGKGFWRAGPIAPGFRHADVLPTITDKAIAWLETSHRRAPDQPLFLYFALNAPHTPWVPSAEFIGKSGAGPYGDYAAQVDHTIGRIINTLDRLGMEDDTLLIVTSDNGAHWLESDIRKYEHLANNHLRGQKADIHDGGHRVPLVARWPGHVPAGSIARQTLCQTDLFATYAAILGQPLPSDAAEDSFNMLPVLLAEPLDHPIRTATVHHSADGMFAIRQGPWKLIMGLGSGGFTAPRRIKPKADQAPGQLYNLLDDPAESLNLWDREPQVVQRLTALLEKWKHDGRSRP